MVYYNEYECLCFYVFCDEYVSNYYFGFVDEFFWNLDILGNEGRFNLKLYLGI